MHARGCVGVQIMEEGGEYGFACDQTVYGVKID